jgi:drug/metabolite transporter (DMT)-like permease
VETSVAGLVLVSAILHPLWNALIKGDDRPERAFLALMALFLVFSASHAVATGADLLSGIEAWPYIVVSSAGLATYSYNLILTYKRGDLSIYYPIIRSSPLFVVVVGVLFLDVTYSLLLLAGIGLVMAGALMLQYRRGTRLLADPGTFARAVVAMAGTGIYSISDARGVQLVEPPVLMFWVQVLVLPTLIVLFLRFGDLRLGALMLTGWRLSPFRYLLSGGICYSSYILILIAYQWGGDVAAVTSVRQVSIPLSVLLGGFFFHEKGIPGRILASLVLAAGIVVIVFSR